ncbi:unnamed protein product [Urochloa humidicola]
MEPPLGSPPPPYAGLSGRPLLHLLPVLTPVPSEARTTKKAGVAQPPRAPMRSPAPAATSTPASAGAANGDGSINDGQQLLEELPTRTYATPCWIRQLG